MIYAIESLGKIQKNSTYGVVHIFFLRILFLVTLLSDLDQSNLRRGYDGKYRNCSRVWFEGSGGMPG